MILKRNKTDFLKLKTDFLKIIVIRERIIELSKNRNFLIDLGFKGPIPNLIDNMRLNYDICIDLIQLFKKEYKNQDFKDFIDLLIFFRKIPRTINDILREHFTKSPNYLWDVNAKVAVLYYKILAICNKKSSEKVSDVKVPEN